MFNDNRGSYEPVSCAGDDGYWVLRRLVTFDANVNPIFDVAQALDEEKERLLINKNTLWFEERVEGQDEDERIIEGGDGGKGAEFNIRIIPCVIQSM